MGGRTLFRGGAVFRDGALVPDGWVLTGGQRITRIGGPGKAPPRSDADRAVDLGGDWLVPGFVDLQVNGGGGILFNAEPSAEALSRILATHRRLGTTSLLATLITDDPPVRAAAREALMEVLDAGLPGLIGVHWEGPWLNPAKAGIHRPGAMTSLTTEEIADLILPAPARTLITLAPEQVPAGRWASLAACGAVLFAGHSDATAEQAQAGFNAGLHGVTHLFNAMSGMTARAPGLAGAALADPRIWAGIIADGQHVHPAMLRLAARAKPDRLFLVSDAMPPVGGPATFHLDGQEIEARDGACRDGSGRLAGSATSLAEAVSFMAEHVGLGWAPAIAMATEHPARLLELEGEVGTIAPNARADLVRLAPSDGTVVSVWQGGEEIV